MKWIKALIASSERLPGPPARWPSSGGKPKSFAPRIPKSLAGRSPWSVRLLEICHPMAPLRKEADWPIPLTATFYDTAILKVLVKIWDFDQSALILLGEPGSGKSPLGRQSWPRPATTKADSILMGSHALGALLSLIFFGESQVVYSWGTSWMDVKLVKAFLDVGLYESMAWAR